MNNNLLESHPMFLEVLHGTDVVDLVVVGQQSQPELPSLNRKMSFFLYIRNKIIGINFKFCKDLSRVDVLEDDVGAGDVDHVEATAHNETPLVEVVSVSLFQRSLQSRILTDNGHHSSVCLSECSKP